MSRFAFYCALILLFLRFSYLHETITFLTGVNTYMLYIFGPLAFAGTVLAGGVQRTFRENLGKYWLGFVLWMAAAAVFSSWPGGSILHLEGYLRTGFCMLFATCGLARTWRDCKQIMAVVAAATLFNLATAHFFTQTTSGDRLALEWSGTIANSNDLAAHLLLVLPFLLFFGIRPKAGVAVRVIAAAGLALGVYQVVHTGSRGALVALAAVVAYVLITGTMRQRIVLAAAVPVAIVVLLAVIPQSTWIRLMSFSDGEGSSQEAMESSGAREYLFRQSVVYTLQKPVFGVGPGQFSSYEGGEATSQGLHGNWHETHNTLTQVSSECGVPALILYLLIVGTTFQLVFKSRKAALSAGREEIACAAFCLMIGLLAFSVATLFVSFAYRFYMPAISGLALALYNAVREEATAPKPAPAKPHDFSRLLLRPKVLDASFGHRPAL